MTARPIARTNPSTAPEMADVRAQWVEQRLNQRLMSHMANSLWFNPILMPGVLWLLWPHASRQPLLLWFGIGVLVSVLRVYAVWRHRKLTQAGDLANVQAHFSRVKPLWVASGLHWSAMAGVFLGHVPTATEFMLWTVLLGIGAAAINSYSANAQIMRLYLTMLLAFAGGCLLLAIFGAVQVPHTTVNLVGMLGACVVFYFSCLSAGLRNHTFQREMLNLQFDNEQLIASLDRQTRQTQEASASRSRLLAGAAHDLRQPVLALSLYADWLRGEPEMAREISPKIMESAAAINRLFDGLFDLAELDREAPAPNLQPVDVAELLKSLAMQYEPQARSRSIQLRLRVPQEAIALSDAATLRRIMGNLIDNAIKYTDQGGVLVTCRQRDKHWHLAVWDTGIGIAADQLDQVFTEFYRVTDHPGTQDSFGLGLAIVQRLATRVDASVAVKSRKAKGSRFVLSLAAVQTRDTESANGAFEPHQGAAAA